MARHRIPSRNYCSVASPEGRRQQIAQFEASLSALRKELNVWWERTGGGLDPCNGPQLLAIRTKVRESSQLEEAIPR